MLPTQSSEFSAEIHTKMREPENSLEAEKAKNLFGPKAFGDASPRSSVGVQSYGWCEDFWKTRRGGVMSRWREEIAYMEAGFWNIQQFGRINLVFCQCNH